MCQVTGESFKSRHSLPSYSQLLGHIPISNTYFPTMPRAPSFLGPQLFVYRPMVPLPCKHALILQPPSISYVLSICSLAHCIILHRGAISIAMDSNNIPMETTQPPNTNGPVQHLCSSLGWGTFPVPSRRLSPLNLPSAPQWLFIGIPFLFRY